MTSDRLARDYLRRARLRREALDLLFRREGYADVICASQEVVELILKGGGSAAGPVRAVARRHRRPRLSDLIAVVRRAAMGSAPEAAEASESPAAEALEAPIARPRVPVERVVAPARLTPGAVTPGALATAVLTAQALPAEVLALRSRGAAPLTAALPVSRTRGATNQTPLERA